MLYLNTKRQEQFLPFEFQALPKAFGVRPREESVNNDEPIARLQLPSISFGSGTQ